jgi:hypothetical protein
MIAEFHVRGLRRRIKNDRVANLRTGRHDKVNQVVIDDDRREHDTPSALALPCVSGNRLGSTRTRPSTCLMPFAATSFARSRITVSGSPGRARPWSEWSSFVKASVRPIECGSRDLDLHSRRGRGLRSAVPFNPPAPFGKCRYGTTCQ